MARWQLGLLLAPHPGPVVISRGARKETAPSPLLLLAFPQLRPGRPLLLFMRGSAAPVRDAKYGIPLHKTPQPPRPWQGITHMPEAELPIRRPAPLVSPAETPELAHIRAPAPAIPLLSSEDCYKDDAQRGPELTPGRARGMRASHDVLQISTPALRGNSPPPNADTADTLPPCTPATPPAPEHAEGLACTDARVGARANALPHDIVTAMALALGAPERPARQSQPDGSKRLAALGEVSINDVGKRWCCMMP